MSGRSSVCLLKGDKHIPQKLQTIRDTPKKFFYRGVLPSPSLVSVAFVGSRAATKRCMDMTRSCAYSLARSSVAIVSGGALGIDTAAHQGALDADGYTIAVFGCGLDISYPINNHALFERIYASNGLLVSIVPDGTSPKRGLFPKRNRIIAGLSDMVVVTEASARSGSLYTVDAALDYGRLIAAVPGSVGTDQLLAQGAVPVTSSEDIQQALAGKFKRLEIKLPSCDSIEGRVLNELTVDIGKTCNDVAQNTNIAIGDVIRALMHLTTHRLVVLLPGRKYARTNFVEQQIASYKQ